MKAIVSALFAGALFGVGLAVSGMTDPAKVLGFLDVGGLWNPALALVMVGAIVVYAVGFRLVTRRPAPWFEAKFVLPTKKDLDVRLLGGAAIFGVGWGVGGYCPGPGIVAASGGSANAAIFVGALIVGMLLQHQVERLLAGAPAQKGAEPPPAPPTALAAQGQP